MRPGLALLALVACSAPSRPAEPTVVAPGPDPAPVAVAEAAPVDAGPPPDACVAPPSRHPRGGSYSNTAGCDEVSCLVDPSHACCAAVSTEPCPVDLLDHDDIVDGMRAIRDDVQACGDAAGFSGRLRLAVEVSPDGTVASSAVATSSGDDAVDRCVERAVAGAHFRASGGGARFKIPLAIEPR